MPLTLAPVSPAEALDAGETISNDPIPVAPIIMAPAPAPAPVPQNEISGAEVIASMLVLLLLYAIVRIVFSLLPYIIAIGLGIVAFKLLF
jgi:hypothetical protein